MNNTGPSRLLDSIVDALCGNPYRPGAEERRLTLVERGVLPLDDSTSDEWCAWWDRLPANLRTFSAAVSTVVAAARLANPTERFERIAALCSMMEKGQRKRVGELACRAVGLCDRLDELSGTSSALDRLRHDVWAAAFGTRLDRTPAIDAVLFGTPVLIVGESGTGRSLIARAFADAAPGLWKRSTATWTPAPYKSLHVSASPEPVLIDALIGHRAHTVGVGDEDLVGAAEQADEGVLHLHDVRSLPRLLQRYLIRLVDEGRSRRLGALEDEKAVTRLVVTASQIPTPDVLEPMLARMLTTIVVKVPALRERAEDVEPALRDNLPALPGVDQKALEARLEVFLERARDYPWPGNLREVATVARELALGFEPTLNMEVQSPATESTNLPSELVEGAWTLDDVKRWYAARVRQACDSDVEAASRLAINRGTLARYLRELDEGRHDG